MDKTTATAKENYVLAMYDVRGKQNFIYRSTHIKEIIGGSDIIRTVFQRELSEAAREYRNELLVNEDPAGSVDSEDLEDPAIYDYHQPVPLEAALNKGDHAPSSVTPFSFQKFKNRMEAPGSGYLGEIVYDGGGNFFILYRNAETCREVTYRFTKKVIEKYASLKVICTYIENLNTNRYHGTKEDPGDYERLFKKHRYIENEQIVSMPYGTLPVVQADYLTSMPLTHFMKRTFADKNLSKLSTESAAKYTRYNEIKTEANKQKEYNLPDEKILDKMVTKKGEESLLAVIYIDGNNMGASVQRCLEGATGYDECVTRLRSFSGMIQKAFIDDQTPAFRAGSNDRMRLVIGAGDEVTVICNARDAYSVALEYLRNLKDLKGSDDRPGYQFTSCAGIAIFHSHAPYAEAYRIAEECCESGKKYMKAHPEITENVCMLDFHYCQGAIGVSLDEIRKEENNVVCSRPWLILNKSTPIDLSEEGSDAPDGGPFTHKQVMEMVKLLNIFGRSNLKGLNIASQKGPSAFELEIRRIEAHMSTMQKKLLAASGCNIQKQIYDDIEKARILVEDIVIVYDLWNECWRKEIGWEEIVTRAEGNAVPNKDEDINTDPPSSISLERAQADSMQEKTE